MLLFLLDLYEILPQYYFSYFIETVALAQRYENGITEKWDPGTRNLNWDPKVELYGETLGWHPKVGPWALSLR